MLALTVRQPWAWAIIHAGKDVENRTWPTEHRGPLAIHAGRKHDDYGHSMFVRQHRELADTLRDNGQLIYGAVIGVVDVIGCGQRVDSLWAEQGRWHWLLAHPRTVEPVPWRGRQGLFEIPFQL